MSALVSPVGGRACSTLSILNISSGPSDLVGSPVNGELSGPVAVGPGLVDRDDGDFPLVSRTNPTTKIMAAIAELKPAIKARRLIRTETHPLLNSEVTTANELDWPVRTRAGPLPSKLVTIAMFRAGLSVCGSKGPLAESGPRKGTCASRPTTRRLRA